MKGGVKVQLDLSEDLSLIRKKLEEIGGYL